MNPPRRPSPFDTEYADSTFFPAGISFRESLFKYDSCRFRPDPITLEESFAGLHLSSPNHSPSYPSFLDSALHGGSTGRGYPVGPTLENKLSVQNLDWNNQDFATLGLMRPQNYCVGSDSWDLENSWSDSYPTLDANEYHSNYDYFLSSRFARQREDDTSSPAIPLSNGHGLPSKLAQNQACDSRDNRPYLSNFEIDGNHPHWLQPSTSPQSTDDLSGSMLSLAKHQFGCRLLQERMTGSKEEEISFIFSELIEHVSELMLDPFGNYVFQKMVEVCTEEQRTLIILMVTNAKYQLVNISLNTHGTRAVQKLLEHATSGNQRAIIISALIPGVVALTKDINGHHVVLHCLKQFSVEQTGHLLREVANHCFQIATDKSGCCVLQQCVDHAEGAIKDRLMSEIVRHVLTLAQDCYGNYVVQHLISLRIAAVTETMLIALRGNFVSLSCNKYASNVVEKFLRESGVQYSTPIILELLQDRFVSALLVDPFGNYVFRSALTVSKGRIRNELFKLMEQNSAMMRTNMYGKKLLARFDRGSLRCF